MKRRAAAEQVPMNYHPGRGGARVGAGRPRKRDAGVPHGHRQQVSGPVHVTLRVFEHVYNLRTRRCFEIVFAAFVAACCRDGFRVVGLSIQGHHLHLLVEAANALALSRGIQGLTVRIAKGLNELMGRRGPVFERFHSHALKTPREVRAAMAYIVGNTAKHAAQVGRSLPPGYEDPYTVGYFGDRVLLPEGTADMVAEPETWLLCHGWQCRAAPVVPVREPRRASRSAAPVPELLALMLPGAGLETRRSLPSPTRYRDGTPGLPASTAA